MKRKVLSLSILGILNAMSINAFGSGYETPIEGVGGFYLNPAVLATLKQNRLILGATVIRTNYEFTGTANAHSNLTGALNYSQTGVASADSSHTAPYLHLGVPLSGTQAFVGLSITSPFDGQYTLPGDSLLSYSTGRYEFSTTDISPSIGYKVNDQLSLGLGFDAVYATASTENAVRFSSALGNGRSTNEAEGWGYGWHAGLIYSPMLGTYIGLSYHAPVNINLTGRSQLQLPPALGGTVTDTNNLSAETSLPPRTMLSIYQFLNRQFAVLGAVKYSQWSHVGGNLVIKNVAGATAPAVTPLNYKDAFDYILGATYDLNKWRLMAHAIYATTTSNDPFRGPISDEPHYTGVIGVGYQVTPALAVNAQYGHTFFQKESVNIIHQPTPSSAPTSEVGTTTNDSDTFGLQLTWDFG